MGKLILPNLARRIVSTQQVTKTDVFTTTSTADPGVVIPGLFISVTLAVGQTAIMGGYVNYTTSAGPYGAINYVRDGTHLLKGDLSGSFAQITTGEYTNDGGSSAPIPIVYQDMPGAGTFTYEIYCRLISAGTLFVNRSRNDGAIGRSASVLTVTVLEAA